MPKHNNIFLIGPMGAGKTTIGRQLARELKMPFYDSDRVIEERTGANIPLIFDLEGEEGFRKREQAVIDDLTGMDSIVLATGGGAVLREPNRRHLSERGTAFYLYTDLDSLLERTRKDKNRPLLHGEESPETVLKRLMEERDPLYRETADHIIDTGSSSIRGVIKAIIGCLKDNRKHSLN
ncbi:MAG: shikimate kinase AroK [Thiotrichales bacterium]|nr:MAG: shikimate kinase AroK [Thiotrichales bacterium]